MGCGCCMHTPAEKDVLRVIVFGLENSGKTSFVQCFKTSRKLSSSTISTHGILAVNILLNTTIHLLVFDCGGCKHQQHIWPHLINDTDLVIFTIDSCDSNCWIDAKQALFDLLADENLHGKPLLVVFTKSDHRQNRNTQQLEQILELFQIQDRPIHKVSFSAVTLDGFTLISQWLAYFARCKHDGKEMKVSTKLVLPASLNLSQSRRSN